MLVFHEADGKVTGTFAGDQRLLQSLPDHYIEVEDDAGPEGDLSDWRVEDGKLVRASILAYRNVQVSLVNREIGELRLRYITALPGQDALYQAKLDEARIYVTLSPEPTTLVDFPLLAGEVGITAPDAYNLAQLWLNMNAMWRYLSGSMENLRMSTINALLAATTVAELDAIEATFRQRLAEMR
jgi:hypothetical protein